jgi:hypothetical protein
MFLSDNKGTLLRGRQQHDETITTEKKKKKGHLEMVLLNSFNRIMIDDRSVPSTKYSR